MIIRTPALAKSLFRKILCIFDVEEYLVVDLEMGRLFIAMFILAVKKTWFLTFCYVMHGRLVVVRFYVHNNETTKKQRKFGFSLFSNLFSIESLSRKEKK